ncbi:MAG TPA: uroporphyrinogen-III synthase [Phycisphaerae bacterium]|nr:uroporphyrinogen-III synthase [Phycisphaerae bacterium]
MIVWVTRDETADGPLCTALRARSLEVLLEPVLERRVVADPAEFLHELKPDDWLLLTSVYAIEAVAGNAEAKVPQVAVVGESSRHAAERHGLRVALISPDGHGETLFARLRESVHQGVVCYPRSAQAEVPESWPGIELRAPVLYETVPRIFDRNAAKKAAIAAVASPSAVDALGDLDIPLASIGRTTSVAICRHGRQPAVEAPYPSFDHLADAIANYLSDSRHHRA